MPNEHVIFKNIRNLILSGKYRVRIHAICHMIEEGFSETNILEAISKNGRIIENYPDDCRCLILGSFHFTKTATSPLHVVCDYSISNLVDILTAYIPQKPWWISPTKRGKIL
jgi:hypothetical protein